MHTTEKSASADDNMPEKLGHMELCANVKTIFGLVSEPPNFEPGVAINGFSRDLCEYKALGGAPEHQP